jgi:2-dehydro-3-deoxygalactonokinase
MHYLSCDWGTSNFRLRLVENETGAGREVRSDEGASKLAEGGGDRAERFRTTLARALKELQAPAHLPILISGMASSSIGWKELPYARLPFALDGRHAVWERLDDRVYLFSGLRSDTEMLRGEETQALGLVTALGADLPDRAAFILPGTHSKHLQVEGGQITSVRTFMTGELFDLLARRSVLRHSTDPEAPFERAAFLKGVTEARRQPLTSALFRVRTRQVLDRCGAASNTAFLSGLLIGAELAALAGAGEPNVPLVVAAQEPLLQAYAAAAEAMGLGSGLRTFASEPLSALGHGVLLRRISVEH